MISLINKSGIQNFLSTFNFSERSIREFDMSFWKHDQVADKFWIFLHELKLFVLKFKVTKSWRSFFRGKTNMKIFDKK